jgi:hypothetical protein
MSTLLIVVLLLLLLGGGGFGYSRYGGAGLGGVVGLVVVVCLVLWLFGGLHFNAA